MTRAPKKLKSSPQARRLIRAVIGKGKKKKSLRAAARILILPTHAQLSRMLSGELADTPAARAWALVKDDEQPAVDTGLVLESVERLERELAVLKSLVSQ